MTTSKLIRLLGELDSTQVIFRVYDVEKYRLDSMKEMVENIDKGNHTFEVRKSDYVIFIIKLDYIISLLKSGGKVGEYITLSLGKPNYKDIQLNITYRDLYDQYNALTQGSNLIPVTCLSSLKEADSYYKEHEQLILAHKRNRFENFMSMYSLMVNSVPIDKIFR